MANLVLITSIINTPNKPLSYTNTRSVFSRKERFEQTKLTIQSIKAKVPNNKILLVECSDFNEEEKIYFEKECDYILNLWDKKELHCTIFGLSKALGEGTLTIQAFLYINENNICYSNLFKISGRYWLNDNFDYNIFNNEMLIFKKINDNNISTVLYKFPHYIQEYLHAFLKDNYDNMNNFIGYETLFSNFLKSIKSNNTILFDKLGVSGYVTVCGSFYEA
jgi:hypothetical protein|uniref:Uncharacterized protein n=1 Tax=viral metagenome TaxID=1070528 RepID=A0A6C0D5V1_9ZZZZ